MAENSETSLIDSTEHPLTESSKSQPVSQPFGWRHALAIIFSLGLTIGIYLLRDQVQRFEELAYLGAFLILLLTNATIILPAPGMMFVFALGAHLNPLLLGLAAGLGAALGEMSGYLAGYGTSAIINQAPGYAQISRWVCSRYGLLVIALMAFIPNPFFDMAGLVAGTLRVKWWHFLLSAFVGKTLRSILVAYGAALSIDWVENLFM